ncbi:MAG TPA: S9 family peptidase [Polyangiaceae bacterium]|nr:S9 family peptidase [Polyangiaceae bacterium]
MIRFTYSSFVRCMVALALCGTSACVAHAAPAGGAKAAPEATQQRTTKALATRHAFSVDDMLAMDRVGELDVSADGKLAVFTVSSTNFAANKRRKDVWLAALDGSVVRPLTNHAETDRSDSSEQPRFAPDGKSVFFISSRGGSSQVWRIAVTGGDASQVTKLPVDVDGVIPFPDGRRLLLMLEVYPDATTLEETAKRDEAKAKNPSKVMAFDRLMIRHWDSWHDGKRRHLFVWNEAANAPVDLQKGLDSDAPPRPFGGIEQVSIAPAGNDVVFASKVSSKDAAWSTNVDLFVAPSDAATAPVNLTAPNLAEDGNPVFSPDGSKLAYLAMVRPGYESDRRRAVVMDWKTRRTLSSTEAWDRSPHELAWTKDSKTLLTTADQLGRRSLFTIAADTGRATTRIDAGNNEEAHVAGNRLIFLQDSLRNPAEVWTAGLDGKGARPLTHINDARVAAIEWGEPEQFEFVGAHGDKVRAWIVKPAEMRAGRRVPVALLIHGGPQGSFGDHFHYRWNPQAYAGRGYATIMIDFHGSTGYGEAFTDAIRGDWGGAPFEDLMKGLDAAFGKYPELDRDRVAGLGASYGGYMINWINGKTDRFKALVCHDGNFDETTAYYGTEELWFPEWEHRGTPWENPESYAKQSPMSLVQNWKTPTLVIQGGRDYRVVDTQGISTFTALQRRGVPSRFLYFPEANHWVLKPLDSKRWHQEVLDWLDRYTKTH